MSSAIPEPSEKPIKQPGMGIFRQLWIVLAAGILLATLYTAWPPVGLITNNLTEIISQALAPKEEIDSALVFPTLTPRPKPRVGIVAGHWGNDSGAVCPDGLTEGQVNLNVATLVKKSLVAEGFDVDLLEEFDSQLEGYQALALVSIHADSCDYVNDEATGFKVAAALASTSPERASRLTACLRSRYAQITGLPYHSTSITPDMTSYHAFGEIHADTTAAIIETGFLNLDRQILTQKPDLIAHGITQGILCFINNEGIPAPGNP